jgi:hypothetical protein
MKKLIVFVGIAVFAISIVNTCHAASIGPVEPLGPMKVAVDAEYNGIFDRDIEESGPMTGGQIEDTNQGYVQLGLGLTDWANVYARLGAANLEQKINWNNGRTQTLKYDYGFLWGVGGNALYRFGNNFGIGGDIQFDMWFTDADSISGTNSPTFTDKGSLKNWEFQTAAYLTYDYEIGVDSKITPYAGGYYSEFGADIDKAISFQDNDTAYSVGDSEGDDKFGLLAGINVAFSENISAKIEGRFIAETAATAGVSYKF